MKEPSAPLLDKLASLTVICNSRIGGRQCYLPSTPSVKDLNRKGIGRVEILPPLGSNSVLWWKFVANWTDYLITIPANQGEFKLVRNNQNSEYQYGRRHSSLNAGVRRAPSYSAGARLLRGSWSGGEGGEWESEKPYCFYLPFLCCAVIFAPLLCNEAWREGLMCVSLRNGWLLQLVGAFEGSFALQLRRLPRPADGARLCRQGAAAAQPLSVNWRRHVCCHLSFGWQARALARLVGKSQQQLAGSGAGKESLGLSGLCRPPSVCLHCCRPLCSSPAAHSCHSYKLIPLIKQQK